jgi:chromatin remodeling complex protein RSC6
MIESIKRINNQLVLLKKEFPRNAIVNNFHKETNQELKYLKSGITKYLKPKHNTTKREGTQHGGFNKKVNVSKELLYFSKWNDNVMETRIDVTRSLCKYIKDKELQHPENKSIIVPDEKLQQLLNPKHEFKQDIKYSNMQKLIQKHIFNI